jgi:GT2 family glycosyltransferase
MDVSIIVVNWNTRELLRNCLASIGAHAGDVAYEVWVVDNHSSDGSQLMVQADFPEVHLIQNQDNVGFARANNQAIRLSNGRYVLLLNSDAVLLPDTLAAMTRVMDEQPRVGVVGAQLLNPDGTFQGSYADFPSLHGELLLATRLAPLVYWPVYPNYPAERSQSPRQADWVSGACLMARTAAIAQVGLLDEEYFMYSEETDWCYRMKQAGWQVYYEPRARIHHWASSSSKRVPERRRSMVYRSKWLFMRKHRGWFAAGAFKMGLVTASAAKLGLWLARSLRPDQAGRNLALQHVRSYRLVLRELLLADART